MFWGLWEGCRIPLDLTLLRARPSAVDISGRSKGLLGALTENDHSLSRNGCYTYRHMYHSETLSQERGNNSISCTLHFALVARVPDPPSLKHHYGAVSAEVYLQNT